MRISTIRAIAILIVSALYWFAVGRVTGVSEPWDGGDYWRLWYPLSCLLAAAGGYLLGRRGWCAGVLVTFAQLPVMWLNGGTGPLLAAGLLILFLLAIPATSIAMLAGWFATRTRASERFGAGRR